MIFLQVVGGVCDSLHAKDSHWFPQTNESIAPLLQ